MKRIIGSALLAGTLLVNGCKSVPPAHVGMTPDEITVSDNFRIERFEQKLTLEEKVSYFEEIINRDLVTVGDGYLLPKAVYNGGEKLLQIENNAAYLSALSFEYGVTKNPQTKKRADSILRGIISLDALDGYDGYVPYEADGKTLKVSSRETHANVYSQILFAYHFMDKCVGENPLIEDHISKIYGMWVKDNFKLKNPNGSGSNYSDLDGLFLSLNPSKALKRLMLDHVSFSLGDEQTKQLVSEHRWKGNILAPLHFKFGKLEIPTSSSSWLNMLGLTILEDLDVDHGNKLHSLVKNYDDLKNPFFQTLVYLSNPNVDISFIEKRLGEFPCPAEAKKITNSHRKEIEHRPKRYVKNTSRVETKKALPLSDITSNHYLWKRNLLELDRCADPLVGEYYGVDFLQAYWMFQYAKKQHQIFPSK